MARDIEEKEEILEDISGDPINFWERKQRELVTSTVDYNLRTLHDLISNKTIDMSPQYQRRYRWDTVRQSKLIESFLMNVPVPPIFLNEDKYGQYSVIDGKQRLQAIHLFFDNLLVLRDLKVFSDIDGMRFLELPVPLQNVISTRPTLRVIIILRQSDQDVKYEVFQRLNTGGVRLNAQEIRNSTNPGPLNDLILSLSEDKRFHLLLGIKNKDKSAIYQEMRDAELVLRFFAFRNTWEDFNGAMKRNMDDFMADNAKMTENDLNEAKHDFISALSIVQAAFGNHAFQRWVPENQQWRQQVLASLYDAEMFACRFFSREKVLVKQEEILETMKSLFSDEEFRKAIDAQTNTPSLLRTRVFKVKNMLHNVVEE